MTRNYIKAVAGSLAAIAMAGVLPSAAFAQGGWWQQRKQETEKRQNTKNQWRNLATVGGGAAILGLLTHNKTIALAGVAGGLYSLNRYEEDRKSQSKDARERAEQYSRPYFERNGQRYERRVVTRNGQKYYQFVHK